MEIRLYNGNGQQITKRLPKIVIRGKLNDTSIAHIENQTGLIFSESAWGWLEAQPINAKQIVALFMTYNFKSRYFDNWDYKNELHLKLDHHVGFDVESICSDCCKYNHINVTGLEPGDRLAC